MSQPHHWSEPTEGAMRRYADLTVRCKYCGRYLVESDSAFWMMVDWRELRKNEICF